MTRHHRGAEALLDPIFNKAARTHLDEPLVCRRAWPFGSGGWSALVSRPQGTLAESWAVLAPGPEWPRMVATLERRGVSRRLLDGEITMWPVGEDPLMAELNGWLATGEPTAPAIIGYKPLRRLTCRLTGADGSSRFAKLMRPTAAAMTAAHHQLLAGYWRHEPAFDIPRIVDQDTEAGRLVWETKAGRPPHRVSNRARLAAAVRAVGRCVASLHRCPATLPRVRTRASELAALESWLRATGGLLERPQALRHGIDTLTATAQDLPPARHVVSHGDLHDSQFLVGPTSITLLDLDTLGRAEPELDIGNLLAHFDLRRAARPAPADGDTRPLDLESLLLEGYARQRGPLLSRPRIHWYRTVAALRLVLVHAPRPESWPLMPHLITLALEGVQALNSRQEEHAS